MIRDKVEIKHSGIVHLWRERQRRGVHGNKGAAVED